MRDYSAVVQRELNSLDHLASSKHKRDATIRALALAAVDGKSITSVLGHRGTIVERTYYDKQKDYFHNADFMHVLERVTALYRERENTIRQDAEMAERQKRHMERAALIREGKGILASAVKEYRKTMAAADRAEKEGVEGVAGVEMKPMDLANFMRILFQEERKEWDETPADKLDLTWKTGLPDGISEGEADAAIEEYAALAVERMFEDGIDGEEG